jgi:hypothetical protein
MTALVTFNATPNRASNGRIGPRFRESWLGRFAQEIRPIFEAVGATIPERIRYSVGWPAGARGGKTRIGEMYHAEASADHSIEVFISPVLGDAFDAADTLVHELVHACLPPGAGHGPLFKALATKIGLIGKMTSAGAGPELAAKIREIIDRIGPYPHAELMGPGAKTADRPKPQKSRQRKVYCPDCGPEGDNAYICRMSQKCIDRGCPTCPCGTRMVPEGNEDEDGEGEGD